MTSRAPSPVVPVDSTPHFDAFFRAEYPRLLRVLSGADLSADDALQEAFTKAALSWKRISAYDDPAGWAPPGAGRRIPDARRSWSRRGAAVPRLPDQAVTDLDDRDASLDLAI